MYCNEYLNLVTYFVVIVTETNENKAQCYEVYIYYIHVLLNGQVIMWLVCGNNDETLEIT